MKGTFRSLGNINYRLWASGAIVSNVGTWMQRTAQDWIVYTELTDHNATALGIVMALQFGPQVLFLPLTGMAADRFDLRKLVMVTQSVMGLLALALGILVVTGLVQLWHVYVFAFALGAAASFDVPARQTFVSELVPDELLSNAVALNSTSFNMARMVGPAVAGVLISLIGTGWVFVLNGLSYAAVITVISLLRLDQLQHRSRASSGKGGFVAGFRYIAGRPEILGVLGMLTLIGMFAFNFPIFISTMGITVFQVDASRFGFLTSMMAVGSVTGALLAARRETPRMRYLLISATTLSMGLLLAAVMPSYALFSVALVLIGMSAQTFITTGNSAIQLWTDVTMRGRVIAMTFAIALGGTPVGALLIGRIADHYGPRWALATGALSGVLAVIVGLLSISQQRRGKPDKSASSPNKDSEQRAGQT